MRYYFTASRLTQMFKSDTKGVRAWNDRQGYTCILGRMWVCTTTLENSLVPAKLMYPNPIPPLGPSPGSIVASVHQDSWSGLSTVAVSVAAEVYRTDRSRSNAHPQFSQVLTAASLPVCHGILSDPFESRLSVVTLWTNTM